MEHLWAPWRMQFIDELKGKEGGCIFCELMLPGDDRERFLLHRGRTCYVVMNRFPYNNGHLMVVPYRHVAALTDLINGEDVEVMRLAASSVEIMKSALEADGFNLGFNLGRAAGAGIVNHIHLHIVPRWVGDANFLPVIGDTRSMPEYLAATYDRLRPGFEKLEV